MGIVRGVPEGPFTPPEFHVSRQRLVAPVRTDRRGVRGPTRGQARSAEWRRSSHGLYVPSDVDPTVPQQRIVEAAALIPPGGGAVTGWAALQWLGGTWFEGTAAGGQPQPVELALWAYIRPQPIVRICEERIDPRDLILVDGLPLTVPARSVCFLMRYAHDVREAVAYADMAMFNDLVTLDELWDYALAHAGWTGIPQCREGLSLADENAWSPMEVRTRIGWEVDAGLPRPLTNVPIFDLAGRHIGTPDLFDPDAGLVVEYDGQIHLQDRVRRRDRDREEAFRSVQLECLTVMRGDLEDRARLVKRMNDARARAKWLPPDARPWTIEGPSWWKPTLTVAQRRALSEIDRGRLLRHRRHRAA